MKQPVSIVIPVFNAELFLERTLLSVQQQTHENLEIIIVNDGSTDTSDQIAARYADSDRRFQVITQRNSGVASARNHGLQHSLGEYVAFLDADDIWHPTKIERQMEVLLSSTNSTGWGSVYCLHRYIDAKDRVRGSGRFWSVAGGLSALLVTLRTECGSSILTRRDLALAVGGFDATYRDLDVGGAEDLDFHLKLAARFPMFVVSQYLVGYRSYEGNMSSDDTRMLRALRTVINRHIALNSLSKPCVNWVFGELYRHFFWIFFLRKREYASALQALIGVIRNDPATASDLLFCELPGHIVRVISRKICQAVGYRPQLGPPFYEVSPHELLKPGRVTVSRRRLRYLAREDAALLGQTPGP